MASSGSRPPRGQRPPEILAGIGAGIGSHSSRRCDRLDWHRCQWACEEVL